MDMCIDRVWERMTPIEKKNWTARYIDANPGRYTSCIARDFGIRASSVQPNMRDIIDSGKYIEVPQKMAIRIGKRVGACMVKRVFPVGKQPEIDYNHDVMMPTTSACGSIWHTLLGEEKTDIILRELQGKPNGLSINGLSKRLGIEYSVVGNWIKEHMSHLVTITRENKRFVVRRIHDALPDIGTPLRYAFNGCVFACDKHGYHFVDDAPVAKKGVVDQGRPLNKVKYPNSVPDDVVINAGIPGTLSWYMKERQCTEVGARTVLNYNVSAGKLKFVERVVLDNGKVKVQLVYYDGNDARQYAPSELQGIKKDLRKKIK